MSITRVQLVRFDIKLGKNGSKMVEILWLEKCLPEFRPVIYKRHVDDTFLFFQNISQIEKFKYYLKDNKIKYYIKTPFRF